MDINKKGSKEGEKKVPESLGLASGVVFLVSPRLWEAGKWGERCRLTSSLPSSTRAATWRVRALCARSLPVAEMPAGPLLPAAAPCPLVLLTTLPLLLPLLLPNAYHLPHCHGAVISPRPSACPALPLNRRSASSSSSSCTTTTRPP